MTPDELRALADVLDDVSASPLWEDLAPKAADYLRQCADAEPIRAVPIGHALSAVRHVGSANYSDRERAAIERLYNAEFDAYTHPAPAAPHGDASRMIDALQSIRAHVEHDPSALAAAIVATCDNALDAAPQAEPIDPHMIVADDRFPDEQVEPKREPLSDWRIGELYRQWLAESETTTIADLMRSVERAHGIGGSDAE